MKKSFKVVARGSRLSVAQTERALAFLARAFPGTSYRLRTLATPGDRDLVTPIEAGAPDFFTRDLDEAVRSGAADFAVHSAKDLPTPMPDDIDWFWLPEREDPRDAWVFAKGCLRVADGRVMVPRGGRGLTIGVSGARRAAYARRVFPNAALRTIRGSIDSRIAQIAAGGFDAVLMAMAGLNRLGVDLDAAGVEIAPIPVSELEPPEAQGVLAVTFKRGNAALVAMRRAFVKAVRFTSAGTGDADYITVRGARDIAEADVVLHDELLGGRYAGAKFRFVGKRCGAHSMTQPEITRLICDEARKGRRVVRLKGGDAGLFGRLAEETAALVALGIPFVVRPGVSALTVATTGTGILLTRRGESRGFHVETPRSTGAETPYVAFMAAHAARDTAARLIANGRPAATPCALVFDAGGPREEIVRGTLARPPRATACEDRPGLFIAGEVTRHAWPARPRVLVTCSDAVAERAVRAAEDRGMKPILRPLVSLRPRDIPDPAGYDAVVLTSPSAVRIFLARYHGDVRRLPAFWTCGAGTDAELRRHGLASDLMPESDFSAHGLIDEIRRRAKCGTLFNASAAKGLVIGGGRTASAARRAPRVSERERAKPPVRVLRLRSALAGNAVARAIRATGAACDDVVLYDNVPVAYAEPLPPFEAVFFASASAVTAFRKAYGDRALAGREILIVGEPTRRALPPRLRAKARVVLDAVLR